MDGENLRAAARAIISANEHYTRAGRTYGFKDQRLTWSDAFSKYVERLNISHWEEMRSQILNAHQECLSDLDDLKPRGTLVERAKAVIATLANYWNKVGAAVARLFRTAPPNSPDVRHGVIQNIFPRPLNEYSYMQPLKQSAQSEVQALQFAENLADPS